jgi:hypothetical protein
MAFNCSVILSDLNRDCSSKSTGGIKRVVLGLKKDLNLSLDTSEENVLLNLNLSDFVVFEHNSKDSTTYFSENKSTEQGNGIVNTDILVRLPAIDSKVNKIEQMSYRDDIVCILYHNNGSVTVSGWKRGLEMSYSASSGASISDISYVDVTLAGESWTSSLSTTDLSIVKLGTLWINASGTWNSTTLNWI